jgi:glycosyltransferase involved in cell wall biosynthesis
VLGGGETHVRALGAALAPLGLAATVVTRRGEADWPETEDLDGIRVVRVPPPGPGRTGKYAMVPAAMRALTREPFDLLVVRGTRVLGLPGLLVARARGKPVVMQAEINGELSGEAFTWGTPLNRRPYRDLVGMATGARNLLLRDAEAFVAMSSVIRDEFLAAGVPEARVHLIPHGVDTERFRPASAEEKAALRARLGWPQSAKVIVYTGRLLRGKGLETLLFAFREVAASDTAALLVLVGSGGGQALSVEDELREMAAGPGLAGRVAFTGRISNVPDFLRAADVFAFPSEFEALGLSLVEACACGVPAVASRTGGIVDVIEDGRSGLLVPSGDRAALAAAMRRLLADEELRAGLGRRGRGIARSRFDEAAATSRYRALFVELARGAAAG